MDLNWTTIIASAVTATVVGASQFVANRYLARILDRIEKEMAKENKNGNGKSHPTNPPE